MWIALTMRMANDTMPDMEKKPWRYSHTQLSTWKACPRLYYDTYVLRKPVARTKTDAMAAGTWLAQHPVETYERGRLDRSMQANDGVVLEEAWANFLAEFGGTEKYRSKMFKKDLAKRILELYKAMPVNGKVVEIEKTYTWTTVEGFVYTSRPDLVTEQQYDFGRDIRHTTWDIKLITYSQSRPGDDFFAHKPLLRFDDQCLGQAICAGADSFGQIQFFLGKMDGKLIGPKYVEHLVSEVMANEWKGETAQTIREIEAQKLLTHGSWPKNTDSCLRYGSMHPCLFLDDCDMGFEEHTNGGA